MTTFFLELKALPAQVERTIIQVLFMSAYILGIISFYVLVIFTASLIAFQLQFTD